MAMKTRVNGVVVVFVLFVAVSCGSVTSSTQLPVDAGDATTYDVPEAFSGETGGFSDASGGESLDTRDSGLVETLGNPALSCKAILEAMPNSPDGNYVVSPTGVWSDAFSTFCDMTTAGGGWTRVTNSVPASLVTLLRGTLGRQMVKCVASGSEHIISPTFANPWSWDSTTFVQLSGTWTVNGLPESCGSDVEYTDAACGSWWGVGCGNGPGIVNKLFPGVLDSPTAEYCADSVSAHTNAAFSICAGAPIPYNFRGYSVFVRED
jgi:hypothetical protein